MSTLAEIKQAIATLLGAQLDVLLRMFAERKPRERETLELESMREFLREGELLERERELLEGTLAAALDELVQRRGELHARREGSASRTVRDFFGCFASGDPNSADNRQMDMDLSREAARGL